MASEPGSTPSSLLGPRIVQPSHEGGLDRIPPDIGRDGRTEGAHQIASFPFGEVRGAKRPAVGSPAMATPSRLVGHVWDVDVAGSNPVDRPTPPVATPHSAPAKSQPPAHARSLLLAERGDRMLIELTVRRAVRRYRPSASSGRQPGCFCRWCSPVLAAVPHRQVFHFKYSY